MQIKLNPKTIYVILITIFLVSALIYNLLYINNKKNNVISDIEEMQYEEDKEINIEKEKSIFVDVSGEVMYPGLYELKEGDRINDAIIVAGGITENADLSTINLAYILEDAIKITIPKKDDEEKNKEKIVISPIITSSSVNNKSLENTKLININTASKEELKNLEGIGESTATKIINYRIENGKFNIKDEIKNVPGIGEAKYSLIESKICI